MRTHRAIRTYAGSTVAALAITLAVAGCSANDKRNDTSGHSATAVKSSPPKVSATDRLWQDFSQALDRPGVALTSTKVPAPPTGFTRADVEAYADKAINMLQRGVDPHLGALKKEQTVSFVFAEQDPSSLAEFRTRNTNERTDSTSQWIVASRYRSQPSKAKFLNVRWKAKGRMFKDPDGSRRRVLDVTLQAYLVQTVADSTGRQRPMLTQRAITVSGSHPTRTGWSPSIAFSTNAWGMNGCTLLDKDLIVPEERTAPLKAAVHAAKRALPAPNSQHRGKIDTGADGAGDFYKTYCT